jgi:hypothetical protein
MTIAEDTPSFRRSCVSYEQSVCFEFRGHCSLAGGPRLPRPNWNRRHCSHASRHSIRVAGRETERIKTIHQENELNVQYGRVQLMPIPDICTRVEAQFLLFRPADFVGPSLTCITL